MAHRWGAAARPLQRPTRRAAGRRRSGRLAPPRPAARPAGEALVKLKPGREKSVREGHPWIFSGAVARLDGPADAPLARVVDSRGEPPRPRLPQPPLTDPRADARRRRQAADRGFFAARLAEAAALREAVLPPETTGYRLVNAEGDGVPGWTVDRFGDVLVSQITASGLEALRGEAYAALAASVPGAAIVQANDVPARRAEGLVTTGEEAIAGEPPAGRASPSPA